MDIMYTEPNVHLAWGLSETKLLWLGSAKLEDNFHGERVHDLRHEKVLVIKEDLRKAKML